MRRDAFVDFFAVDAKHQAIHLRLENWARWCFSVGGSTSSPMFRLYRPDNYEREVSGIPVDIHDAQKLAKGVAALPVNHRLAITWNYLEGGSPMKARKRIGVSSEGLMLLIRDGRTMLINRKV